MPGVARGIKKNLILKKNRFLKKEKKLIFSPILPSGYSRVPLIIVSPFDLAVWLAIANMYLQTNIYIYERRALLNVKMNYGKLSKKGNPTFLVSLQADKVNMS